MWDQSIAITCTCNSWIHLIMSTSERLIIQREKQIFLDKNLIHMYLYCLEMLSTKIYFVQRDEKNKMNTYVTDINHRLCPHPPHIFLPHSCKT